MKGVAEWTGRRRVRPFGMTLVDRVRRATKTQRGMIVLAAHGLAAALIVGAILFMGGGLAGALISIVIAVIGAAVSCALWLAVVDALTRAR